MSESSEKGKSLEKEIASILRKKLNAHVERDRRSGAGQINKMDLSDWYREIPLAIEAKNHKTVKIKDWFRQAEGNASMGQAPTVVFSADDEVLACLRFSDLLDFLVEIKQQKVEIEDLRKPVETDKPDKYEIFPDIPPPSFSKTCRNGHLSDEYGYCQQLECKYSRGYKIKKVKAKK